MNGIRERQSKYFEDCQRLISELQYIDSKEELIENKFKLERLVEYVSILKYADELEAAFEEEDSKLSELETITEPVLQFEEEEALSAEDSSMEILEEEQAEEPILQEESVADLGEFTFELAGEVEEEDPEEEVLESINPEVVSENEAEEISVEETPEEDVESSPEVSMKEQQEGEPTLEQVIEEHSMTQEPARDLFEQVEYSAPHRSEKKFKLASIRGLGQTVKSLFEEEELEAGAAKSPIEEETKKVSLDYMQAPTPRPEFKLDLNDRIAFTKTLFDGSQAELNHTVNALNEFKTLDEAKRYLSEVYYQRNWKKADEYAQRLWLLVENKFQ